MDKAPAVTAPGGRGRTPVPLALACWLGVVGVVPLVLGAVFDVRALSVAGVAAGTLSLGAALFWRSELITAYRAGKRGRTG
ncbi:MAG: hypothetical protein ACRDZW_01085 [Acidimicrobiales bacterium]